MIGHNIGITGLCGAVLVDIAFLEILEIPAKCLRYRWTLTSFQF